MCPRVGALWATPDKVITNVAKEIKNFGYMKFRIFMVKASNIIDVGESIKGGRLHNLHILTRS